MKISGFSINKSAQAAKKQGVSSKRGDFSEPRDSYDKTEGLDEYLNPVTLNRKALRNLKKQLNLDKGSEWDDHSVNALLLSSVKDIAITGAKVSPVLSVIGGVGTVGLLMSSGDKLTGEDNKVKLQATSDLGWGLQGSMVLAGQLGATGTWIAPAATGLGVAGGSIQTYLGVKNTYEGIAEKNSDKIVNGTLNTAAGACWIMASSSIATPITAGSFIGLTLTGKLYKNKEIFKIKKEGATKV